MANGIVPISKPQSNIPTYLPVADAAKKFGMPKKLLTQMARTGKIEAVQLPSGELLVSAENGQYKTKEQIIEEEFSHLRDQSISASEASRRYSELHGVFITRPNFSRWAEAGYIEVEDRGYRLQLNEADVAYCAKIYAEKYKEYNGKMRGVPVFDSSGNPYQLKDEEIAEKKRIERQQKKQTS